MAAITNYHDFDYSYVLKDAMAKKESISTMMFLLEDIILMITFNTNQDILNLILNCLIQLSWIVNFFIEFPYFGPFISQIHSQANIIQFVYALITLFFYFVPDLEKKSDFSIWILVCIPLSIKASKKIYDYGIIHHTMNQNLKNAKPETLDIYLRSL